MDKNTNTQPAGSFAIIGDFTLIVRQDGLVDVYEQIEGDEVRIDKALTEDAAIETYGRNNTPKWCSR